MNLAWLLAEFIGTFTLIFIGAGSVCLNTMEPGSVGLLGIAIAHGLAIAVMVSAFAHISGAKLNPAVSLGVYIGGNTDFKTAVSEIGAQLLGAIVGALCLKAIFPLAVANATNLGTPAIGQGIAPHTAIFAEGLMTFLLIFTVYATAIDPRGSFKAVGGFAIGCVIIFDILAFAGITGAAINPARAFGPALVSGVWTNHYIYWIGPIVGGLLAGFIYNKFLLKPIRIRSEA